ncbi:MAG: sensor histidine kinase [Actinomycetota bacterium]
MKKPFIVLLHCGYWFLYLLLLAIIFATVTLQVKKTPFPPSLTLIFPIVVMYLAPNLVSFYSFYFLLFPRFLFRRKILALVIFGTLVCLISAVSGNLIALVLFGFDQPIFTQMREFLTLTVSLSLVAAIHGIIALVIRGFITWYAEIKLKEELAQKSFEMELALIKSQINPHFLFNTINNIDVLITKDAAKASEYLNKLSDILRYMVYETKTEKIALAKELGYIEKYLELQKIRTTNLDYVSFEVTGNANNLTIAPMILFPFIENAFKHTENNKRSNTIKLKITNEDSKIGFECENTYQKSSENADYGGLGNQLIQKRLMLIYPNKHLLEIADNDGIYKVKLMIDIS